MRINLKPIYSLFLLVLLGCNFKGTNAVTTKEETIEAIIGKWQHADLNKSDVKQIVFTRHKNKSGDYTCVFIYKKKDNNGNISDLMPWRYVGVGKIELFEPDVEQIILPVDMVDNKTFGLNGDDLYTKKE
jgi:hypothetical protein